MSVNWIDVSALSFNTLLLLEQVQLSWLPAAVPSREMATALHANPVVAWYLRHKCPQLTPWLDEVMARKNEPATAETVRRAEIAILKAINDWVVYVVDPAVYDRQPFLEWDTGELVSLADFTGKTVIDVGAGTGRLALVAAVTAAAVFAVEPVANLRHYLRQKARQQGFDNLYVVDGLITSIPFPDHFAHVTMGGHVFGDDPEAEYREVVRVTRRGGMIIFCPGNRDCDDGRHQFLLSQGFQWSRFEEPQDGMVRKYWKIVR